MQKKLVVKDKTFVEYISESLIQQRITAIASQINKDFAYTTPLFIGVLNGSVLFCADLFKQVSIPCELSFIKVASYKGMESSGELQELIGLSEELKGREVIVVEDIVDTGLTIDYVLKKLAKQQPAKISVATLLLKPGAVQTKIKPGYVGFEIPNDFVIGYGLDYDGLGRNLKDIYTLQKS